MKKIWSLFTQPKFFFNSTKKDKDVIRAILTYIPFAFIGIFLWMILTLNAANLNLPTSVPNLPWMPPIDILTSFSSALLFLVFSIPILFAGGIIIHGVTKGLGIKGNYKSGLRVTFYSTIPHVFLSWIPFIGLLFTLWTFYLLVKGISIYYKISQGRSLGIVLIAAFISLFAFILTALLGAIIIAL